jgi:hypothetical protein
MITLDCFHGFPMNLSPASKLTVCADASQATYFLGRHFCSIYPALSLWEPYTSRINRFSGQ